MSFKDNIGVTEELFVEMVECAQPLTSYDQALYLVESAMRTQRMNPSPSRLREELERALELLKT
jgi:hypothetical protein